jgi:Ni,Fe-hydrogenase III small subunit
MDSTDTKGFLLLEKLKPYSPFPPVCDLLPVGLLIPSCPPRPLTILDGLLRLIGRIKTI